MGFLNFRIPKDLNPKEILSNDITEKFIYNAMILLGTIRVITNHVNFHSKKTRYSTFAEISIQSMRKNLLSISGEIPKLISRMTEIGWIKVDPQFKKGEFSRGYKIGPRFKNSTWIEMDWKDAVLKYVPEILTIPGLIRCESKIYSMWENVQNDHFLSWQNMPEGILKRICEKTMELLNECSISADDNLEDVIQKCAKTKAEENLTKTSSKKLFTEEQILEVYRKMLSMIRNRDFYVKCHDQRNENYTNRLFTNFANLKSEFRQFILLDGRPLVSVDIKCSQPSLLSSFYKELPFDIQERARYLEIISSGDLYQHLADKYVQQNPGNTMLRKEAKTGMFTIMFGKNNRQKSKFCDIFREEFPVLIQRIYEQKIGDYKNVARMMQLKESSIMIEGVLKELLFEKKIKCLSIHDSISCFKEDVDQVQACIIDHFLKEMGFIPQLKIEGPSSVPFVPSLVESPLETHSTIFGELVTKS